MNLRFRTRIALYNTMAVTILIAVAFLAGYGIVYSTSYRDLDSGTRQESEEAKGNIEFQGDSIIVHQMPEWQEAEHNQVELNPTFLQIADIRGITLFKTVNLLDNSLPVIKNLQEEKFFNATLNDQHIRIGVFPIRSRSEKIIGTVAVGVSEEGSFSVLNSLRLTFLISFPLMLLILFFVSSFAASKGIEPVHNLIRSAAGINDSNINTRLPLPAHNDEIYKLAGTINDLLDRIENSILQQKQFTSDASHEMRTPLAAIRGTLEVLIRRPHEQAHYELKIREVIRQVDRIEQLIGQLLQLTRLESGTSTVRKENLFLLSFLLPLREKWQGSLSKRETTLQFRIPAEANVITDPFFLEIILDNLVSNVLKYGKERGTITFSWDSAHHCLSVSDDGPGIPAEHLPRLFDRFYRSVHSQNSQVDGHGLGLAIVKKMADLQKIRISVSSSEGSGARVDLRFPAGNGNEQ